MKTRWLFAAVVLGGVVSVPARAQQDRADRWLDDCRRNRGWGSDARSCDVQSFTVQRPGRSIDVNGGDNGGVTVHGWDKSTMLVVAMIQASADREADARDLASQIKIEAGDDHVRANGPSTRRHESWSVSYDIYVPRRMDIDVEARNGGIDVEDVSGRLDLKTRNGGIRLTSVSGDVHATTTNGGVTARLSGTTWDGGGLEVRTTNGGVTLEIPRDYNARLETGTVNGGLNIDFPITVQGSIGHRVTTTLGRGGPTVHATTTNGGVHIATAGR